LEAVVFYRELEDIGEDQKTIRKEKNLKGGLGEDNISNRSKKIQSEA